MEEGKTFLHVNFPNNLIFFPDRKERLGFSRATDGIISGVYCEVNVHFERKKSKGKLGVFEWHC
jgi:hypothetical protein